MLAEYNPNDEPVGEDLEPVDGNRDVTVPPSAVVDFQLP
jgi:hypothetical protein